MEYLLMILLLITAVFLILLILIQRGRGGGLAGAFGGLGGQSAFGTKAGDVFTKITIYVAFFWIVLCVASVKILYSSSNVLATDLGTQSQPAGKTETGEKAGAAASTQKESDSSDTPTSGSDSAPAKSSGSTTDKAAGESKKMLRGQTFAARASAGGPPSLSYEIGLSRRPATCC
jgi:preprotein translocase subunit SecG